jgi:hypothetical protein
MVLYFGKGSAYGIVLAAVEEASQRDQQQLVDKCPFEPALNFLVREYFDCLCKLLADSRFSDDCPPFLALIECLVEPVFIRLLEGLLEFTFSKLSLVWGYYVFLLM